jgi:hypothetical protein
VATFTGCQLRFKISVGRRSKRIQGFALRLENGWAFGPN